MPNKNEEPGTYARSAAVFGAVQANVHHVEVVLVVVAVAVTKVVVRVWMVVVMVVVVL